MAWPSFGVYIRYMPRHAAYEPAALAFIAFGITAGIMGLIQFFGRGTPDSSAIAGALNRAYYGILRDR